MGEQRGFAADNSEVSAMRSMRHARTGHEKPINVQTQNAFDVSFLIFVCSRNTVYRMLRDEVVEWECSLEAIGFGTHAQLVA